MTETDNNTQGQIENSTDRHYLGSSYSIFFEILFLCIIIVPLLVGLIAFVVAGFTIFPWAFIGVVPMGIILLLLGTYTGGLRYEIANGHLMIKSGLLRRLIEKISLDSIFNVEMSDQIKFEAQSNFWFNYQSDGHGGFYKVYNRNFKRKAVMIQISKNKYKYLLGSKNPDVLKAQIESYVNIQKNPI